MNEPPLPEPSALANLAERCQVTLHVARHALRRLADAPAGEIRVLEELFAKGPIERAQMLTAVLSPSVSMRPRSEPPPIRPTEVK